MVENLLHRRSILGCLLEASIHKIIELIAASRSRWDLLGADSFEQRVLILDCIEGRLAGTQLMHVGSECPHINFLRVDDAVGDLRGDPVSRTGTSLSVRLLLGQEN